MARPHNSEQRRSINAETLPILDGLRKLGMTYQSIANNLQVSYITVYRAINRIETYKQ